MSNVLAGQQADQLTATEVAVQEKMWGASEERIDAASKRQLLGASAAQILFVKLRGEGLPEDVALEVARDVYPEDWDTAAFRSYGSDVANLVVAAAFLRNEIKRLIADGADTTRTKRGETYRLAAPFMTSDDALAEIENVQNPN